MSQPAGEPVAAVPSEGLRVSLLGEFAVRQGDVPVELPPSTWRLVALLALERRRWSRSRACRRLWADHDEVRAHAILRTVLWRLRQSAPSLVEVTTAGLRLAPATRVDVDEVEQLARSLEDGAPVEVAGVDPLVFGQDLLPDWSEDFVEVYRESCRQVGLHALERLARRLMLERQPARALSAGLAAVTQAPLRESAHRVVMEIHLAEGNVAEAVRQYDVLSRQLWAELRLRPSAELAELLDAGR